MSSDQSPPTTTHNVPSDPTESHPSSAPPPAQTVPQSAHFRSANFTQFPNDPFSDAARNLFSAQPGSDDAPDPFSDSIDLTDQLSLRRPLDAVKFLLKHCLINQMDPELFSRLKQRAFTVPHAVEQLVKEDAYFKCLLLQLYAALQVQTGLDMRAALSDFRSDAIAPQTSADELADLILIYCVYRAGSLHDVSVPVSVVSRLQEITEIVFRTPRCDLLRLVQQCRDGIARYENSGLLTGASLDDSPGQFFLMDTDIRPKFIHILVTCVSLYLTSNTALLVDIPLLISRLLVGEIQSHVLKQATIGGCLERVEDWLARRRLIEQDLKSACLMIGKLQDFPGESILIADAINHALHPVFSETLRLVIRLNGVPRNLLTWSGFESLMADAQLQHDADPDTLVSQLAAFQSPVVLPNWTAAPFQALAQLGHPLPVASAHKQVDDIAVDLSKLPPPPRSFPKDIKDCFDVAIACRECPQKFLFTVTEQDFYIRTMEEPHFPVRCGPCRHHKKLRNNDPLSVNSQSAQQPGNTTAGLVIANDALTEVVEFADGDDFQF